VGVSAHGGEADFRISGNDAVGSVSSVAIEVGDVTMSARDDADFRVSGNEAIGSESRVDIEVGTVTMTASDDADFRISGNEAIGSESAVDIEVGTVTMTASDDADFRIYGNASAVISVGDVTMGASDDAFFGVGARAVWATGSRVDENLGSEITIGDVNIGAGGNAAFWVVESDSDVVISATIGSDSSIERGTVDIDAASVGFYPVSGAPNFANSEGGINIVATDGADIILGDVAITAAGSSDSDVTVFIDSSGEDSSIDIGGITVSADSDVHFTMFADDVLDSAVGVVKTGNINITSGLEQLVVGSDATTGVVVSSDLFFMADNLSGNEDVEGAQTITLTAESRSTFQSDGSVDVEGQGNVYVDIYNAPDLVNLKVSGTNAEIYLEGDIGINRETGPFTLDLSGMSGRFGSTPTDITTFDPLGSGAVDNRLQDDGTYVVTVDADFGGAVVIRIGSGDLVYNAQHSNFLGSSDDLVHASDANFDSDWFGREAWFSLGDELSLDPTAHRVTFTAPSHAGVDIDNNQSGTYALDLIINGVSYDISLVMADPAGGNAGDNTWAWNLGSGDGSATQALLALGITPTGTSSQSLVLTGPASGESFTASTANIAKTSGTGDLTFSMGNSLAAGVMAVDGLGNDASETFMFVGETIGDVVIGGFRPNGVFDVAQVDRLDFTMFDDIMSAGDLRIYVEEGGRFADTDGYFNDVIIDFVNLEYGSIRLVGVGEYFTDANVNGIANSIIFA
jgi:hypothetical protein